MRADPTLSHRLIKRHPSGQGSVITFDMYDRTVELFVADAKYRTVKAWASDSSCVSDIPEMYNFQDDVKHIHSMYAFEKVVNYMRADARIQNIFPSLKTDKTAKENTDILMGYEDTDAAHYCRSINIEGVGVMDLPNIYELMAIYLESDRLDELDPTLVKYPQYALGSENPSGRFHFGDGYIWSSTEHSSKYARGLGQDGRMDFTHKIHPSGIVPVKEISISPEIKPETEHIWTDINSSTSKLNRSNQIQITITVPDFLVQLIKRFTRR